MPHKPKTGTVSMFIKGIPRVVRQNFKAWCTLRGIHMQDQIIYMMKKCVKDTRLPGAGSEESTEKEKP